MEKARIFPAMIPEFERSVSDNVELRALAILDRIYIRHIPKEKALAPFGMTWEEVEPFEKQWAYMRKYETVIA
jgi:isocitrate dehydrogenase kinase/phosphatase